MQPLSLSNQIAQLISSFSRAYIIPYLPVLVIALIVVWVAFDLTRRRTKNLASAALRAEIRTNTNVTKAIIAYADSQLSGETCISPMPRYHMRAFLEYKRLGMMEKMPSRIAEELENLYLNMESVNRAGKRQEDLAFGPAASFPNAQNLRIENLTFARDTVHNIIAPYEDRLSVKPK